MGGDSVDNVYSNTLCIRVHRPVNIHNPHFHNTSNTNTARVTGYCSKPERRRVQSDGS